VSVDHHGQEHEFEPVRGLPERLPAGERIVWQGSPQWRALALGAFHLRVLSVYFGVMLALVAVSAAGSGSDPMGVALAVSRPALLAAAALALVALFAWMTARATVYTLTDRRVVMRMGIVLTVTYNLPYRRIMAAAVRRDRGGTGDLPLQLKGGDRIAYLHLWPHARPWHLAAPQPMFRAIAQVDQVAALLTRAWSESTGGAAAEPARSAGRSLAHAATAAEPAPAFSGGPAAAH
jgi:Bacterial PH domain